MKKIIALMLAPALALALCACGKTEKPEKTEASSAEETAETVIAETNETFTFEGETLAQVENAEEMKILVAYLSVGEAVKAAADAIAEKTGAEVFEIKTERDYETETGLLYDEIAQNLHPVISDRVDGMESYDAVFLGFPEVDGRLPMAVVSFMEEYDLRDKVIIPFCAAAEGADLSNVTGQIDNVCFGASQTLLITVNGKTTADDINARLTELGF